MVGIDQFSVAYPWIDAPHLYQISLRAPQPRLAATVHRQEEGVGDIEPAGMIHVVAAGADGLPPFIPRQKRQTTNGIHRARSRPDRLSRLFERHMRIEEAYGRLTRNR